MSQGISTRPFFFYFPIAPLSMVFGYVERNTQNRSTLLDYLKNHPPIDQSGWANIHYNVCVSWIKQNPVQTRWGPLKNQIKIHSVQCLLIGNWFRWMRNCTLAGHQQYRFEKFRGQICKWRFNYKWYFVVITPRGFCWLVYTVSDQSDDNDKYILCGWCAGGGGCENNQVSGVTCKIITILGMASSFYRSFFFWSTNGFGPAHSQPAPANLGITIYHYF